MYDELYEVYEKLCEELCEYGKKDLDMENLKVIDTLAHAGKNVMKIMECESGSHALRDSYGRSRRSYRVSRAGGNNVTDGLKELMYAAPAEMQGEINRLIKRLENM